MYDVILKLHNYGLPQENTLLPIVLSLDLRDSQLMQAVIVVAVHQVQAVAFVVIWTACPMALKRACLCLSTQ